MLSMARVLMLSAMMGAECTSSTMLTTDDSPFVTINRGGDLLVGNGNIVTKMRTVQPVDAVEILGNFNVMLRVDPSSPVISLAIQADENLMDSIKTMNNDDRLIITTEGSIQFRKININIVLPRLRAIRSAGSSKISCMDLHEEEFDANIEGRTRLSLSGAALNGNIHVHGGGRLYANNFELNNINILMEGPAIAEICAHGVANVTIRGNGLANIGCSPREINHSIFGSGKIMRRQ